ncbi:MAG: MMPL family transporter [Treponema sp.]|jgi:predicted RND superfamily exporter protein|nr:MMPL family transporter [Treponema sp.]
MRRFFRYPVLIAAVIAAITVFFGFQLPKAEMNNNNIRFVPADDPALLVSEEIDDTFGSSLFILVGLEHRYKTIFDPVFLKRIKEYTAFIENECEITGNISSIMDTDYITASGDSIVVENLVPGDFTGTPEEIAALRGRLRSWEMYDRSLVSDDFSSTQILIPLKIENEDAGSKLVTDTFRTIRGGAHEMFDDIAKVYVAGLPVISSTINEATADDLVYLIPLVVLVVLAVLFFSFRRLTAVLLPLITVLIAVIWSIGAMPLFGVKLSILSTVLPVILVAVGSAYGIHVITHYMEDLGKRDFPFSDEEHRELVFALLRKIGKPVMLAALTTFAGFVSFCFTAVPPIREFGYFSSFGVVASFLVAVTLIPALLILRGPKPMKNQAENSAGGTDSLNESLTGALLGTARKKGMVLITTCLAAAVSVYGLSKLVIDNVYVEYFKNNTDVRQSDVFIREKFGGSKVINVVVEADDSAALLMPEVLTAVDGLQNYLQGRVSGVGKVMGFTDLVKRTNQVFNIDESPGGIRGVTRVNEDPGDDFGFGDFGFDEPVNDRNVVSHAGGVPPAIRDFFPQTIDMALLDRAAENPNMSAADMVRAAKRLTNYEGAAYYEIPADPARYGKTENAELSTLVSNYLVLLSGSTGDYANDALEPTAIRTTVQVRTTGDAETKAVLAQINDYVDANFPDTVRVRIGGPALVDSSLSALVVESQIISVAVSVLMVFTIIALSNRSLTAGLVGILPLFISILINFAVMGFLGIKLNLGTSLVASVSVGIGIDYAIHFIDAYKREYLAGGDFLRRTFATSGKAIIINAVSVGAGFAVLALSRFVILASLGLLMTLTMFTSALISLTVIPVLLGMMKPKFIYGQTGALR